MYRFSLCKTLLDELDSFGLLWCFYQLFGLSLWWHPFTAEDPLVSEFLQTWWRNKLIYILDGLRVSRFSAICFCIFGWTIPLMHESLHTFSNHYIHLLYITNPGLSKSKALHYYFQPFLQYSIHLHLLAHYYLCLIYGLPDLAGVLWLIKTILPDE